MTFSQAVHPGQIQMPIDPVDYAVRLYDAMHALDAMQVPLICVERPPDSDEWTPVLDRLMRASHPAGMVGDS